MAALAFSHAAQTTHEECRAVVGLNLPLTAHDAPSKLETVRALKQAEMNAIERIITGEQERAEVMWNIYLVYPDLKDGNRNTKGNKKSYGNQKENAMIHTLIKVGGLIIYLPLLLIFVLTILREKGLGNMSRVLRLTVTLIVLTILLVILPWMKS